MNQRRKKVEEALGNLFSSSRKSAAPKESNLQSPKKSTLDKTENTTPEVEVTPPGDLPHEYSLPPAQTKPEEEPQKLADEQAQVSNLPLTPISPKTTPENEDSLGKSNKITEKAPQVEKAHPAQVLSLSSPQEKQVVSGNGNGKQPIQAMAEKEEIRQLVVFNLAGEAFGLPIERVESIIKTQSITVVPHARPYVVGVTNLRGTVLPVIDLRRRFNYPKGESDDQQRIVVVSYREEKIGLRVDAVSQVLSIAADAIEPPPPLVTAAINTSYIIGIAKVEDKLVILLDLDKVLSE